MSSSRLDPFGSFNFYILLLEGEDISSDLLDSVDGMVLAGFTEVSGLDATIGVYEYLEGGVNDRVHKFADRASFSNIVLKRGLTTSLELWQWYESFVKGEGQVKDGLILLANDVGIPVKVWHFSNGMPVKWSGPSLNAMSSGLAIEALEIAHEKLDTVEWTSSRLEEQ